MTSGLVAPATLPPKGLPGLDPLWSRLVTTADLDGIDRTWHILDNHVVEPTVTLLCVHGNPTWSYLWRDLLANAPEGVRVIAVDQLDMGFSERTGTVRRLGQRIEDLCALTDELDLTGRVVTVAHDWGGPISLGWAERHEAQLVGIVLANTAVHQPEGSPAPTVIRMVRLPGVLRAVCQSTPAFIRGAMALSRPRPTKLVRAAYEAPYRSADRRAAIAAFVEDIPLSEEHPSHLTLTAVADGLQGLQHVPSLLLWGPSDPVFSDLYLDDFSKRLPEAKVHRYIGASHLVPEDVDISAAVCGWLQSLDVPVGEHKDFPERAPLWSALEGKAGDDTTAIVEMGPDGPISSISFAELHADVERVARGFVELGVAKGDRIAMLVTPGIDLTVSIFSAWMAGAVVVLADAGLGARGLGRALASADPDYIVGIPKAISAAKVLRWPGIRISTARLADAQRGVLGVVTSLQDLRRSDASTTLPAPPTSDAVAGIGFTSGATGPAKGVVYRHRQMQAQRDVIRKLYRISTKDSLVAAFGPFSLFGPILGIPSVVPDMEVTSPGTLTASALADAASAVEATLVFASPAALRSIAATSENLSDMQRATLTAARLLMSAGAPVNSETLRAAGELMPHAEAHTPYGMTEAMPIADIDLDGIEAAGARDGVCVGRPVPGVEVRISPIDSLGVPEAIFTDESGVVGEVCVSAAHMRDGYDKLWATQDAASRPEGWHRTGDVGHIDDEGRLWIEGRLGHVVTTAEGPVTPVGIEHAIESLDEIALASVVGVGPAGTQQVIAVLEAVEGQSRPTLATEELSDTVRRRVAPIDIAAVLIVPVLPVDKRHNSKIDRTRIATWAERVLSGGRMGKP